MEKTRRACSGTLSEVFGERALSMDKFARSMGYRMTAMATLPSLDKEDLELMKAYSNGVNDFAKNIHLTKSDATAKLLPPEFYALGIK